MTNYSLFLLLLLIFISSSATAEIKTREISSSNWLMTFLNDFSTDDRPMIVLDKFRFARTGHVSISVKSFSVAAETDFSRLGFFLVQSERLQDVFAEINESPNFCVLDSRYIKRLFNFSEPPQNSFNRPYPVTVPGEYRLFFTSCAPDTSVSMQVRTEVYNLNPDGSKHYLSAGLTDLPSLYFYFSLAYLLIFALLIFACATNKPYFPRIHLLMGGLLLVRAFNLLCSAMERQYVKIDGTTHGWDVLSQISQFIHIGILFTMLGLICTRFSLDQLYWQGKKALLVVIPLQPLTNLVMLGIDMAEPFEIYAVLLVLFFSMDVAFCYGIY